MLTVEEVRTRLGISRRGLYGMMERGAFPRPVKIPGKGNKVFFEPEPVDGWFKANPRAGA